MNKQTETATLKDRIAELEAQVEQQNETIEAAEQALTDAYASGDDPQPALETLAKERDKLSGQVGALRQLEQRVVEVSQREATERRGQLKDEAHKRYKQATKAITKPVKDMDSALSKALPKDAAKATMQSVDEVLRRTIWESINEQYSGMYLEYVPQVVRSAPARDERGRKVEDSGGIQYMRSA
jgi:uncharacterized coiled-coil protein SlyX